MSNVIRSLVQSSLKNTGGCVTLGESASYNLLDDPARMLFSLSRYKFVSKMFSGFGRVLEVGCADGLGAYLVSKSVTHLTCVDIDPVLVDSGRRCWSPHASNISFETGDVTRKEFLNDKIFDGVFLLDVLEHIPSEEEDILLSSLCGRLERYGSLIIGMPSLESQEYASSLSKIGHINCKSASQLHALCLKHFNLVYMFGANDEVVHTGYPAMQHYRLALCAAPRGK